MDLFSGCYVKSRIKSPLAKPAASFFVYNGEMKYVKMAAGAGISLAAGFIGSYFTAPAIPAWYAALLKPELAPPNWIFAPVWTLLFILMGVAAGLVWDKGLSRREVKIGLGLFGLQLVLNTLWSIIFFGWQNPGGAFAEIIALWLMIAATIYAFYKVSRPAAWMLAPYIIWVSFAAYLNYAIWQLN